MFEVTTRGIWNNHNAVRVYKNDVVFFTYKKIRSKK